MQVIISGRHFDVSDELKSYCEEKLSKLSREYPKLTTARIVMDMERNWNVIEAHVEGKQMHLNAESKTQDMYASVDDVVDKLEKQLLKRLGKRKKHKGPKPAEVELAEQEAEPDLEEDTEEYTEG